MPPPSVEVLIHTIKKEREKPEPNEQAIYYWKRALMMIHGVDYWEEEK